MNTDTSDIEMHPNSPDGSAQVQVLFGDRVRDFFLPNESLIRIEQELDESVFTVLNALVARQARITWIKKVLIEGLIGGGMSIGEANGLFKLFIEDRSDWANAAVIASIVLVNAVSGPVFDEDDPEESELGKMLGLEEEDPY